MTSNTALVVAALVAAGAVAGCARGRPAVVPRWSADLVAPTVSGDRGTTDTIARGVVHRAFVVRQGPLAVHVLDVDRQQCWDVVARKGVDGAVGRMRTSELASVLARDGAVAGAVNADFFLFTPPGVPAGAFVREGAVITGPGPRPVFAIDSAGRPWIGVLTVTGIAMSGVDSIPIESWNRTLPTGLAWFDSNHRGSVDTATGSVRVTLSAGTGLVDAIDTALAATPVPSSGGVLVLGGKAPAATRERFLLAARSRGRFAVSVRLMPIHPRDAVGGFPVLVRDSAEVAGLDSAGAPTFAPVRHPRTIVGVAAGGRRVLLITVDGRQAGYSVGTTLRESARLALELGAREAINLDGGGSTTLVVPRRIAAGRDSFLVANRPSDPQGERAVGNALVVQRARTCR